MFGNRVPDVLQDMKKAKFRDEVIGPIGLFVKIAVCLKHLVMRVCIIVTVSMSVSVLASVSLPILLQRDTVCFTPWRYTTEQR